MYEFQIHAKIKVKVPKKKMRCISAALKPDIENPPSERVQAKISYNEILVIDVLAKDLVGLRAGLNSYLRLLKTVEDVLSVLDCEDKDLNSY